MGHSPPVPRSGFAQRLRRKRLDLELSQAALAELVGSHQPTVSAWEAGLELPSRSVLLRLAKVLGERVDFLLDGIEQSGDLEDLVLRVLDRIDRKDLELLVDVDEKLLAGMLVGLRAHHSPRSRSSSRRR